MTTTSFPIVNVKIDHAQWRDMFSGPTGHTDGQNEGLSLTLSSTDNTATIATGKYRFMGYYLKVTAPHGLTLAAAVGSPKTYQIGVMYDPSRETNAAGPLYLYADLKSAIAAAVPSGGAFAPLYEVTRQVSQALNLATVTQLHQWILPLVFRFDEAIPSPASYGYGQPLAQHNPPGSQQLDLMIRRGGGGTEVWESMIAPHAGGGLVVDDLSLYSSGVTAYTPDTKPWWTRAAGKFHVGGAVKKTNGQPFFANQIYNIANISAADSPIREFTRPVAVSYDGPADSGRVHMDKGGTVLQFFAADDTPWFCLDGIDWFPKGS